MTNNPSDVPLTVRDALGGPLGPWEAPRPEAAIAEAEQLAEALRARGWVFDGAGSGREYVSWHYHPNAPAGSAAAVRITAAFMATPGHTGSYVESVTVHLRTVVDGQTVQEGYVMSAEDFHVQLAAIEAHTPEAPAVIDYTAKHRLLPDRPVKF